MNTITDGISPNLKTLSTISRFRTILLPDESFALAVFCEMSKRLGQLVSLEKLERKTDRLYDIRFEGFIDDTMDGKPFSYGFSGWLPLGLIRTTEWTDYAAMSDIPEMVREGDWSGIRDSSTETIWKIFGEAYPEAKKVLGVS